MIRKNLPGFSFLDPKTRVMSLRLESHIVVGEPRFMRVIWTPELAEDIQAFHNINAEDELTALLSNEIRREIDNQIIRDIRNDMGNDVYNHFRQWTDLINNNQPLIHHGHRAPQDEPPIIGGGGFDNLAFPMVRRVFGRTLGTDLVNVQPLELPTGLLRYIDYNYGVLPNEEGWYTNDTWESIFINMCLRPHKFIEKTRRGRRGPINRN